MADLDAFREDTRGRLAWHSSASLGTTGGYEIGVGRLKRGAAAGQSQADLACDRERWVRRSGY